MRATWAERSFVAAVYDFGVEREWLARPVGRLLWGTDVGLLYSTIRSLGSLPSGSSILDVPCGGGLALRGLRPGLRYVGVDIAPRGRAAALSPVKADIERLPFADNEFDVCVTFNGLHCLPDPAAALRELARCVKPGGRLVGDTIVRGAGRDLAIGAFQRVGLFGPGGTAADLARWLTDAGFHTETLTHSGAVVHFAATR